jgi:hypothetical protein
MRDDSVNALMFWPEKRIKEAFRESALGIKAGEELKALRIFHRRMKYFLKTSSDIHMGTDGNEEAFVIARYEKPILDRDIAKISGANIPERKEGGTT